jgi:large subunit ribosomal protein LP0
MTINSFLQPAIISVNFYYFIFFSAFKNCASLCAHMDFSFKEIDQFKAFIADPSKFAVAAAPAASTGAAAAAPVVAAKVEEEEEEADMGFDLFD